MYVRVMRNEPCSHRRPHCRWGPVSPRNVVHERVRQRRISSSTHAERFGAKRHVDEVARGDGHHAPREQRVRLGVHGVEHVAAARQHRPKRQQQLHEGERRARRQHQHLRCGQVRRTLLWLTPGRGGGGGGGGGGGAATFTKEGGQLVQERDGGDDHHPRELAEGPEDVVCAVERCRHQRSRTACLRVQQRRCDREVERRAAERDEARAPRLRHQPRERRRVDGSLVAQLCAHRLVVQQPVDIALGHTGVDVDDADLGGEDTRGTSRRGDGRHRAQCIFERAGRLRIVACHRSSHTCHTRGGRARSPLQQRLKA